MLNHLRLAILGSEHVPKIKRIPGFKTDLEAFKAINYVKKRVGLKNQATFILFLAGYWLARQDIETDSQ